MLVKLGLSLKIYTMKTFSYEAIMEGCLFCSIFEALHLALYVNNALVWGPPLISPLHKPCKETWVNEFGHYYRP